MGDLENLQQRIRECELCPLREGATQPVPGLGEVGAKYMLIGEAPGKEEDKFGMPFVGQAGKRLSELLALAGIDENDCYFTNVVHCRPPNNRDPRKGEVKACSQFLWEEIKIVQPEQIITLGRYPLGLFCPYTVTQMHGTAFMWEMEE